jgi:hypothetical protein
LKAESTGSGVRQVPELVDWSRVMSADGTMVEVGQNSIDRVSIDRKGLGMEKSTRGREKHSGLIAGPK